MGLNPRVVGAAALLLSLVGVSAALVTMPSAPDAGAAEIAVEILAPDGPLWNGTVRVDPATALTALEAAAAMAELSLTLEDYPGMGTYVRAIGPYRADGAAGWVYETRVGSEWRSGDRTAAAYALAPGTALRWTWVDPAA